MTFAKGVQTMASHTVRLALAAAAGVVVARTLQPDGRGLYAVIITAAGLAISAGHLSVVKSQIALWPNPAHHRSLVGNGLILGLLLGSVSALATLGIVVEYVPLEAPHLLALALLAVPFGIASANLNGILFLQARNGVANRAVVVSALVMYVPILVLGASGDLTVMAVVLCWTIATAAPCLLFIPSLGLWGARADPALARRQLALSGRYHIGNVSFQLLLTVDLLLLNSFASSAQVGLYTVAVAFLALANVPTDATTQITLARQAVDDGHDARQATARALRLNLLFSSVAVGVLAMAASTLIPLLYGAAYAGSVAPLLARAPGAIALSLLRPAEQYLVRLGRPMTMTAVAVGALTVNLALNMLLIPEWGATGAAVAASVSYIAMVLTEVLWFARVAGVGMRELLPRVSDLRSVVSALPAAGRLARPWSDARRS
ncbi:lipopolysaccharide biosynthesis protein [Streptosporangium canum]|uniref:lipopolysaccharide biosynthesis protein n=1 Tax=Streptosporangium canum TaxID=324952 RepID=UPI0036ABD536